jgi:predicted metal-dependent HD superfamily phosphohydrolase
MDAEKRFADLWRRLGIKSDPQAPFERLKARYSEGRHYHNLDHVLEGIGELDKVRDQLVHPDLCELAYWYHDVVYDTRRSDNEERSAEFLLRETAGRMSFSDINYAKLLIRGTEHKYPPFDQDQAYVIDVDLISISKPYKVFREIGERIRKEYSWVPEPLFKEKRAEIFERFLAQPSIYNTDLFKSKYEAIARGNLEREISYLRGPQLPELEEALIKTNQEQQREIGG